MLGASLASVATPKLDHVAPCATQAGPPPARCGAEESVCHDGPAVLVGGAAEQGVAEQGACACAVLGWKAKSCISGTSGSPLRGSDALCEPCGVRLLPARWLKVGVLAEARDWDGLEAFAAERKSPIGWEPFLELARKHGAPRDAQARCAGALRGPGRCGARARGGAVWGSVVACSGGVQGVEWRVSKRGLQSVRACASLSFRLGAASARAGSLLASCPTAPRRPSSSPPLTARVRQQRCGAALHSRACTCMPHACVTPPPFLFLPSSRTRTRPQVAARLRDNALLGRISGMVSASSPAGLAISQIRERFGVGPGAG